MESKASLLSYTVDVPMVEGDSKQMTVLTHHTAKIQEVNKKQGRSQPIAVAKGLRRGQLFYMVAQESLSDTMAYDRHQTEARK